MVFIVALKSVIGKNVKIDPSARINVSEKLIIGEGSVINKYALIEGRSIVIGREAWIDEYAHIGGGSCFEKQSELVAGDFLHMGKYSHINTARRVTIGDEVGIGINTKVFTHGSYLSVYDGFPVEFKEIQIGDRVWLPNAWVNPGVTIGDDVVVAAYSLVNKDIPSGSLAGGIPAKILKEKAYPRQITEVEKQNLIGIINEVLGTDYTMLGDIIEIRRDDNINTIFDLKERKIEGKADEDSERLKNQLRRFGIRFKYSDEGGMYKPWQY